MRTTTALAVMLSVGPLQCALPAPIKDMAAPDRQSRPGLFRNETGAGATFLVTDYGAVGDGVTDDTAAIQAAVLAAKGSEVHLPRGIFRVTAPLIGDDIRIRGAAPAYVTNHGAPALIPDLYASAYSERPPAALGLQLTVILCDGVGLIGGPDSAATLGATPSLRSLRDVVVWGVNGAKIGLHLEGADTIVAGCTFVLFEWFGILSRGLITSAFRDLSFVDCGWNLPGTGDPASGHYYSGAAQFISASKTPGDLVAIDSRPTTITIDNTFAWQRNETGLQRSGFRTLIAYGLASSAISALQGYSGAYLRMCTGTSLKGYHLEDYSSSGFAAGDRTPYALYVLDSVMDVGAGYAAHMTGLNLGREVTIATSNESGRGSHTTSVGAEGFVTTGPVRSDLARFIEVLSPGGTDTYVFRDAISARSGFTGLCVASLVQASDLTRFSRSVQFVGTHDAGGSAGWQVTSTPLAPPASTFPSGTEVAVSASFNGPDLVVSVAWGVAWSAGTRLSLSVGLLGTAALPAL